MPVAGTISDSKRVKVYCVDPTDGFGKFELVTPNRPGPLVPKGESRRTLAVMTVRDDERAKPVYEGLELHIMIDRDFILHASAKSSNMKDFCFSEIYDLEFALVTPNIVSSGWRQSKEFQGEAHDKRQI